ncbi:MAG TPA: serine/threonine-protein kinase [Streptosporangiaceae bacterium]|nr:serine/threonine-protein kinase [Streptosporangiaceae bacterium]
MARVTSDQPTMSDVLPLRETDPREVGNYRLLGRLGEGGQGVVFLAVGPTGSHAAVKLLSPTTDPQVRSRFLKEVAAAQRVARFCTAQVLDAGIFERRPFIVTEYVDGPSLVEVVEQYGPQGDAALERIAIATLTALGIVHAAGMVHRDFKPGNVLLGPDGPVVIDFGLAAVPGMTTAGPSGHVAVGTPAFMAPEQLAGNRVTAAADMWSWGVTMVFAGTGELPFRGGSLTAAAFAILHSEPRVGRLPEPLGSLVYRCLTKDPALRPSARGALAELVAAGALLVGPMPPVAPPLATDEGEETSSSRIAPTAPGPRGNGDGLLADGLPVRRRSARRRRGRTRRRRWVAVLLAAIVLVAGVTGLALNLPRRGPSSERPAGSRVNEELAAEATARAAAINWIVGQVSRSEFVSCDPEVCADLANEGFPNVETLGPEATDPLGSALVVATAAVRAQFGGRLASVYAPVVLASFGSGNARIEILWVFPGGTAKYLDVRQSALSGREGSDAELLANSRIQVSPKARAQLLSGDIDPQLPQLLAIMAAFHPVSVVSFVNQSPGGGPGSLMRSVDLATADPAAHLTPAAYLGWMQAFLNAQRAPYRPTWMKRETLHASKVLMIGYGAPSPLSLQSPQT